MSSTDDTMKVAALILVALVTVVLIVVEIRHERKRQRRERIRHLTAQFDAAARIIGEELAPALRAVAVSFAGLARALNESRKA